MRDHQCGEATLKALTCDVAIFELLSNEEVDVKDLKPLHLTRAKGPNLKARPPQGENPIKEEYDYLP